MKGEDVKKILAANGFTQQNVADMLGISRANLNGMLGKEDIRTGLLESISRATGIPLSAFFQGPHGAIDFKQKPADMDYGLKSLGRPLGKRGKGLGAGVFPKLSSNWARHTWATMCAELDVPDPTISLGMGHRIAGHRTTAIYIRRDMKKVDDANRLVIDYIKNRPASLDEGREH